MQEHGGSGALCRGTVLRERGWGSTVAICTVTHRLRGVSRSWEAVARDDRDPPADFRAQPTDHLPGRPPAP